MKIQIELGDVVSVKQHGSAGFVVVGFRDSKVLLQMPDKRKAFKLDDIQGYSMGTILNATKHITQP